MSMQAEHSLACRRFAIILRPELHLQERHGGAVAAVGDASLAGSAEAEALVDVASARIVLEDMEPEALGAEFAEDQSTERSHRRTSDAAAWVFHHDAPQPQRA